MNRRHFFLQLAVCALGLCAFNVAADRFMRRDPSKTLIRAIDAAPPADDLLAGNSLMDAAADLPAYDEAARPRRGFNIALGGSSPLEHDLLLRRAARLGARRVFYGWYDLQQTEPISPAFAHLAGNRARDHYLDRETAIRLLMPGDPWRAWRVRLVARLPLVVDRQTLWARVERLRRSLGGIGTGPAAETNRFGRVADFSGLEAAYAEDFARVCRQSIEERTPFSRPVADMLALARAGGVRFVFVEMPMRSAHRERFYSSPEWRAYVDGLRAQIGAAGADFLDASTWIADDGFGDAVHVNLRGAAEFSRRLGEEQAGFPVLP